MIFKRLLVAAVLLWISADSSAFARRSRKPITLRQTLGKCADYISLQHGWVDLNQPTHQIDSNVLDGYLVEKETCETRLAAVRWARKHPRATLQSRMGRRCGEYLLDIAILCQTSRASIISQEGVPQQACVYSLIQNLCPKPRYLLPVVRVRARVHWQERPRAPLTQLAGTR